MVVLTALQVEYEAMRRHMTDVREVPLPQGTLLDLGRIPGLNWSVALAETGPTNTRAALVAQHAIEQVDPDAVFFVGVAGGLKEDVRPGDVVVASKVYGHHGGRESADGFAARPEAWQPTHAMDQLVRSARRNTPWAFLPSGTTPAPLPRVHFEPIASGDVLLAARDSETFRRIKRHYNDAVAVDMESFGVTRAAGMNPALRALCVRGISDNADPDKSAYDAAGSQETAARHAAAFALRLLRDLRPAARPAPKPAPAPSVIVVSGPEPPPDPVEWKGRPVVTVGAQEYLLHDGPDDLLHETEDHDVVRRQAVARVVSGSGTGTHVWLRQVERIRPSHGPGGSDPLAALEREARLCRRLGGPDVVQLARGGTTATLALAWPGGTNPAGPAETLHAMLPDPPAALDPMRLWTLVKGLAAVAEALERLSATGHAHRALRPTAIVLHRPRAALRDLGLAAVPPRPGENPGPFQAPEQRYGSGARPGPATDVYQLGALLHRALTGRAATPDPPPHRGPDFVPDGLVHVVAAALRGDPRARPRMRTLRLALRAAARELASVPPSPR
ncbi:hypothetical protein [Streptomyces sp. NPDC046939]|uniref:phosphorylase family protein n=1 Tax=Streptomyces sp. NPDC046939 TaxID=3155376 RepID=UPI00340C1FC8